MTARRALSAALAALGLIAIAAASLSERARAKAEASTTASPGAASPAPAAPAATASAGKSRELFQGFLVAANATDMFAPEFIFRVPNWSSDWGARKLLELAPDGKAVKRGDVVARFEFGAEEALRHINDRISRATNDSSRTKIESARVIESLEMELRRKQIDLETARLNLEKERALSRRQADQLKIQHRLAQFDVEAATQKLASERAVKAADNAHKKSALSKAEEGLQRYEFYKNRFTLKAPHDGVVRHAFNPRERRKLQKGDNTQAGMKIVSLAQDDALAVRFFVPEAQASSIAVGTKLAVVVPTSAEELEAVVASVDFFPQEIGFLLENEGLPNGREKAIQVRAAITSDAKKLAAGTEVRVKVKP